MNVPSVDRLLRATLTPDEYPMTPELETYEKRLKQARAYLLEYPMSVSAQLMMDLFGKTESYSRATAYRDLRDARTFFGQIDRVEKEFDRLVSIARLEQSRKMAEALAKTTTDYYNVARIDEIIAKLKALDKHTTEVDIKKLQPPAVHIYINTTTDTIDALTGRSIRAATVDLIEGQSFTVAEMENQILLMDKITNPNIDE